MSLSTGDTSRQMFKPTRVVDHRVPAEIVKKISYDGRTEYLVKWAGLPNSCNTWESPIKTPSIVPLIHALENPAAAAAAAFAASSGSAVGADSCTPGSSKAGSTSTLEDRVTPASSIGNESIGADFAGLDVSGNAAVAALVCMTTSARTSPAEFNPQVPPTDWSSLLLTSAGPAHTNPVAAKRAQKPPRPANSVLAADGKPKPRRRANSHGSSLHDVGTRVVISAEKGEHDGAKGYVSRVPVHPSTWYEVTLNNSGTVLKLRSSSFRVITEGTSPTSPEKRPLELDIAVAEADPPPAAAVPTSAKAPPTVPQNKKPRTPKTALPEMGQQVIITGDKGGRQGQRGTISRTPDHPSTWYELTLHDGEVLKLRSTSFTTNLDWSASDDEASPSEGPPSVPTSTTTAAAAAMGSVAIAAAPPAPQTVAVQPQAVPPLANKAVNHIYKRLKDEDAMSDSEHGDEDDDEELEGTPCC